jgi:hypothetical protein
MATAGQSLRFGILKQPVDLPPVVDRSADGVAQSDLPCHRQFIEVFGNSGLGVGNADRNQP